jgi:hypothetical protein
VLVYVVVDDSLSPTSPLGDSLDVFVRRGDAERLIEEVRGDEPELAKLLRIEVRELEARSPNSPPQFRFQVPSLSQSVFWHGLDSSQSVFWHGLDSGSNRRDGGGDERWARARAC